MHEALRPAPPPPSPAVWRRYERRHPHSLWHGDFMDKTTLSRLARPSRWPTNSPCRMITHGGMSSATSRSAMTSAPSSGRSWPPCGSGR
jgi:hypothetical protein